MRSITAALVLLSVLLSGCGAARSPGATSADPGSTGFIAFLSDRDGGVDVYALDLSSRKTMRLTRGSAVDRREFDPFDVLSGRGFDWSPAGDRLLFAGGGVRPGLYVADGTGAPARKISRRVGCARWSPDGTSIALVEDGDEHSSLWVLAQDGKHERRVASALDCPVWAPDGRWIAFLSRDGVRAVSPDGSSRRILSRHAGRTGPLGEWSPDGRSLLVTRERGESADIYVLEDGSERLLVRDGWMPAWSPDGARVAYVGRRGGGINPPWNLAVVGRDGAGKRWLTEDLAGDLAPAWSPDGSDIVYMNDLSFTREWPSGYELFVVGADGDGPRRLTRNKANDVFPLYLAAR